MFDINYLAQVNYKFIIHNKLLTGCLRLYDIRHNTFLIVQKMCSYMFTLRLNVYWVDVMRQCPTQHIL